MRTFANVGFLIVFVVAALLLRTAFSYRLWRGLDMFGVRTFFGLNVHGMKGASAFVALLFGGLLLLGWLFPRAKQWLTSDDERS